jgi:hypothetical protein
MGSQKTKIIIALSASLIIPYIAAILEKAALNYIWNKIHDGDETFLDCLKIETYKTTKDLVNILRRLV